MMIKSLAWRADEGASGAEREREWKSKSLAHYSSTSLIFFEWLGSVLVSHSLKISMKDNYVDKRGNNLIEHLTITFYRKINSRLDEYGLEEVNCFIVTQKNPWRKIWSVWTKSLKVKSLPTSGTETTELWRVIYSLTFLTLFFLLWISRFWRCFLAMKIIGVQNCFCSTDFDHKDKNRHFSKYFPQKKESQTSFGNIWNDKVMIIKE